MKNYYIKGDNLHVMNLLINEFSHSIDFVYLDPPYSSGRKFYFNERQEIISVRDNNSSFDSEGFLERLEIAWEMLSDTGVLVITIGEDTLFKIEELIRKRLGSKSYVTMVVIEYSFLSQFPVDKTSGELIQQTEYVLIYSKNAEKSIIRNHLYDCSSDYPSEYMYIDIDSQEHGLLEIFNCRYSCQYESLQNAYALSHDFRTFVNSYKNSIYKYLEGQKVYLGNQFGVCNDYNESVGYRIERGTLWKGFDKDASFLQQEGGVSFYNGKKPVRLIQQLIFMLTSDNAVILDPYSGSGTTAHAVMNLNASISNSQRRFILVQRADSTSRGPYKDVCELALARIENVYQALSRDKGYSMNMMVLDYGE